MNLLKAELHFKTSETLDGLRKAQYAKPKIIYLNENQIVSVNHQMEVTLSFPLETVYGKFADKIVLTTPVQLPKE